jgi:hypothetical protein
MHWVALVLKRPQWLATSIVALGLAVQSAGARGTDTDRAPPAVPHYKLQVAIDPVTGSTSVAGQMTRVCLDDSTRMYLNRDAVITDFRDQQGPVEAHIDTAAASMPYASIAKPLVLSRGVCDPVFRYHVSIRSMVSDVNVVSPTLVELASYSGWYPAIPTLPHFTYDVVATMPPTFGVVTNGDSDSAAIATSFARRPAAKARTLHFASTTPTTDIVLVAAPGLHRTVRRLGSAKVAIYSVKSDSLADTSLAADMASALRTYTTWFGTPSRGADLRIVQSPRAGWGYSRLPLILGSADFDDAQRQKPFGRARSVEGNAHELAHFWWKLADPATPDDWLNEGLAEYSAFSVATLQFGPAFRDSLLSSYTSDASRGLSSTPIAGTPSDASDRYVNRYERPVLLLSQLEQRVGAKRVRVMLRQFYGEHREPSGSGATTEEFLATAGRELGAGTAEWLRECIVATTWTTSCLLPVAGSGR